ncbi:dihydroxy-acid dehydratase [Kocuria rhizophila]|nr:dihydroxy-acid dehydratase [Kocuria rhizophila]
MNYLSRGPGPLPARQRDALAAHVNRKRLFLEAGRRAVDPPRSTTSRTTTVRAAAQHRHQGRVRNAMALDMRDGGSTNTRPAHPRPPRRRPRWTSPSRTSTPSPPRAVPGQGGAEFHEVPRRHVRRAGGIPAILGELRRGGLLNEDVHTVAARPWASVGGGTCGLRARRPSAAATFLFLAAPAGCAPPSVLAGQRVRGPRRGRRRGLHPLRGARLHRRGRAVRVLFGNVAEDSACHRDRGHRPELFHFTGRAFVVESQDEAIEILSKNVTEGVHGGDRVRGPRVVPDAGCSTPPATSRVWAWEGRRAHHGRPLGSTSGLAAIGHISRKPRRAGPSAS